MMKEKHKSLSAVEEIFWGTLEMSSFEVSSEI